MGFFLPFILFTYVYVNYAIVCPGNGCSDEMTCCFHSETSYGCCPLKNAVCCSGHLYCCPAGNRCDTVTGQCLSNATSEQINFYRKIPTIIVQQNEDEGILKTETVLAKKSRHNPFHRHSSHQKSPWNTVKCPDHKSLCPGNATCCLIGKDEYGCCPAVDAVCCEDHVHCCPHGTTCNIVAQRCAHDKTGLETPWYKKFPSLIFKRKKGVKLSESHTICANGDKCPGVGKCCMNWDNEAFCCPFSNGACCMGATHCCPQGFRCDSTEGKCIQGDSNISVTMDYVSTKESMESVLNEKRTSCPDSSVCGHKETCCPIFDVFEQKNIYKCCNLNLGTCCENHCCPRGYHCADGKICERSAFNTYF